MRTTIGCVLSNLLDIMGWINLKKWTTSTVAGQDSRSILLEMAILGTVPMPEKRQWTIFLRQQWHWTTTSQEYHLIGTRIWRAALPPGCDPVRSPMCGCTPTVLSPVRCGYWDCFRWLSQYVGCHWACTNSKGLDVVNENFLEVVNYGSTLRCQRLGQIQ